MVRFPDPSATLWSTAMRHPIPVSLLAALLPLWGAGQAQAQAFTGQANGDRGWAVIVTGSARTDLICSVSLHLVTQGNPPGTADTTCQARVPRGAENLPLCAGFTEGKNFSAVEVRAWSCQAP